MKWHIGLLVVLLIGILVFYAATPWGSLSHREIAYLSKMPVLVEGYWLYQENPGDVVYTDHGYRETLGLMTITGSREPLPLDEAYEKLPEDKLYFHEDKGYLLSFQEEGFFYQVSHPKDKESLLGFKEKAFLYHHTEYRLSMWLFSSRIAIMVWLFLLIGLFYLGGYQIYGKIPFRITRHGLGGMSHLFFYAFLLLVLNDFLSSAPAKHYYLIYLLILILFQVFASLLLRWSAPFFQGDKSILLLADSPLVFDEQVNFMVEPYKRGLKIHRNNKEIKIVLYQEERRQQLLKALQNSPGYIQREQQYDTL